MTTLGRPQNTPAPPINLSTIPSGPPPIHHATSSRPHSTGPTTGNLETTMRSDANPSFLQWGKHEMQEIPMGYKILSTVLAAAFMGMLWIYFNVLPHRALESGTDWNPEKATHTLWVGVLTALALVLIVGLFIICLYCAREGERLGLEDVRLERLARDGRARQPRPLTGSERRRSQRQQRRQREQEQVITNLTRAGII